MIISSQWIVIICLIPQTHSQPPTPHSPSSPRLHPRSKQCLGELQNWSIIASTINGYGSILQLRESERRNKCEPSMTWTGYVFAEQFSFIPRLMNLLPQLFAQVAIGGLLILLSGRLIDQWGMDGGGKTIRWSDGGSQSHCCDLCLNDQSFK